MMQPSPVVDGGRRCVGIRRSLRWPVLATALATVAVGARAQEAHVYVYGTQGLAPVPFEAANRSDEPIVCGAAVAHWYSEVLGEALPGGAVEVTLWSDPRDGAIY